MSFKLLLNTILICLLPILSSNPISDSGTFRGKFLGGRVKIVDRAGINGAFRVKVVDRGEHMRVIYVDRSPNALGEWQIVDRCEDFKVCFVDRCEDFRIRLVDRSPGLP